MYCNNYFFLVGGRGLEGEGGGHKVETTSASKLKW